MWPWVKIQIVPRVNIPIPSKMGGEFIYSSKWDLKTGLTTTAMWMAHQNCLQTRGSTSGLSPAAPNLNWLWVKMSHHQELDRRLNRAFHSPGFHVGYLFLTHSQLKNMAAQKMQPKFDTLACGNKGNPSYSSLSNITIFMNLLARSPWHLSGRSLP